MPSPLESAITLDDVFAMVVGKRVPLAPELAGYLSLEIAEKADAAGASGDVDPRSVYIADEGTVALVRPQGKASGDAEQSIRGILGQLLDASGSSTPALAGVSRRGRAGSLRALMEDIEAALIPVNRAAGRRALARLAREVKRVTHGVGRNAPSGRSASGEWVARGSRPDDVVRREPEPARAPAPKGPAPLAPRSPGALRAPPADTPAPPDAAEAPSRPPARLPPVRAPQRASQAPAHVSTPPPLPPPAALFDNPSDVDSLLEQFSQSTTQSEQAVSRDLKDLVDIGETAPPPLVQAAPPILHPPSAPPPSPDVDDLLAMSDDAPVESRPPSFPAPAVALVKKKESVRPVAAEPTAPASVNPRDLPTHQSIAVPAWSRPKKKRTDYWIIIAIMALLATASATVWFFKPGLLSGRTAEKVAAEKAANEALRQKMAAAQLALQCHAAIDVTDIPSGAEVLLRVGQAPVDVPHLPVGTRLEFVATAEGYAPKRVVVPATATWDNGTDGKPRFELAVELNHSNPKARLGDAWPPAEPGSEVGGKGPPGVVHVVSTPRGAEIWMLAGLGPESMIEQLPCDQTVDVLVAGPTTFRKRLHAGAADFVPRPGEQGSKIAKVSAR